MVVVQIQSRPQQEVKQRTELRNKRGLSGLEVGGLIAFALAFLWLCGGYPHDSPSQWVVRFFGPSILGLFSPAEILLLFCAIVYSLLVGRYNRH